MTENYTQEVRVHAVRALYPYQSKTFSVERGDLLELKEKSNEEWWLVETSGGREGFAPANYLKELGLQRMTKLRVAKRPAANKLSVLLEKKERKQANKLRRKTTSIQPRQLQHLATEGVLKRQVEVNHLYTQLTSGAVEKRKQLDNAISFYKWLRKIAELERWVGEKRKSLSVIGDESQLSSSSLLDEPDAAKRRHQAFSADFLANQAEYAEVAALAGSLADPDGEIKRRQEGLVSAWQKLLELKQYWDNAVKAIQCIDRFNLLCAEASDQLAEKLKLGGAGLAGEDEVRSVRALQSRQDKLERDIGPIEANVGGLRKTAEEVCRYFPQETANVRRKLGLVEEEWLRLREDVRARKAKLDEKHGLERFENEVSDFGDVCQRLQAGLADLVAPVDLRQCEEMEKRFAEIEQEFADGVAFRFGELKEMSQRQLAKRGVIGSVERINEKLSLVAGQRAVLVEAIGDRRQYLGDFHR